MKVAFDTSVLVAAVWEGHAHHAAALAWLSAAKADRIRGVAAWHAAAETWSVLTRLPLPAPLPPAAATGVVQRVFEALEGVPTSQATCERAMALCELAGLRSGALFDALHVATAEKVKADVLLTLNLRDFERFVGVRVSARSPLEAAPP